MVTLQYKQFSAKTGSRDADHSLCRLSSFRKTVTSNLAQYLIFPHFNAAGPNNKGLAQVTQLKYRNN